MSKVGSSLETDMTQAPKPPAVKAKSKNSKLTAEQKEAIAKEEILFNSDIYKLPNQVYEENGSPYDHYREQTER